MTQCQGGSSSRYHFWLSWRRYEGWRNTIPITERFSNKKSQRCSAAFTYLICVCVIVLLLTFNWHLPSHSRKNKSSIVAHMPCQCTHNLCYKLPNRYFRLSRIKILVFSLPRNVDFCCILLWCVTIPLTWWLAIYHIIFTFGSDVILFTAKSAWHQQHNSRFQINNDHSYMLCTQMRFYYLFVWQCACVLSCAVIS